MEIDGNTAILDERDTEELGGLPSGVMVAEVLRRVQQRWTDTPPSEYVVTNIMPKIDVYEAGLKQRLK